MLQQVIAFWLNEYLEYRAGSLSHLSEKQNVIRFKCLTIRKENNFTTFSFRIK